MNNINKLDINSLKNLLRADISIYDDKTKDKNNNEYLLSIYKEILSLIDNVEANQIMQNSLGISLLFSLIYDESMADNTSQSIYKLSYLITAYSKNEDYEKELLKAKEKLSKLVRKINDEYETIINKNRIYAEEIHNLTKQIYIEKGILYRLNDKKCLEKFQIHEVKKLLKEKNWNENNIIIILEHIRNHNIRCSYDNPKISYTTINMLENDFDFYGTDDLMNIESKNKFDSHINTMFDSVSLEEDLDIESFVNNYTNWMNRNEYDYTMRNLLNKFIDELKKCQDEMVQNYEDFELRKIIIEDYNHYYYKFLKFKKYYDEKLHNIEENDTVLQSANEIEENNLFFAMTNENSYIEKDIEHVPKEYLQRVKKLLEGFKFNTLTSQYYSGFCAKGKFKGYRKLKDDQIRIVFRKINNNNFLILGLFVKKSQRDSDKYANIVGRDTNYSIDNKLEESTIIYNNLMEFIENNSRKGNR